MLPPGRSPYRPLVRPALYGYRIEQAPSFAGGALRSAEGARLREA